MSIAQPFVSSVWKPPQLYSSLIDPRGHLPTTPKVFCPEPVAPIQRSSKPSSRCDTPRCDTPRCDTPSTCAPSRPASQASSSPPVVAAQPRSKSGLRSRRRTPEPESAPGSARSSLRRPLSSVSSRIHSDCDAVSKDDSEAWQAKPNLTCTRKLLCNFTNGLGQRCLLTVANSSEPIRPPYKVNVRYDLRPVNHLLSADEFVFLAALDIDKLRRKGSGSGLDVVQCSDNWIARDCLCTKTGKMRMLLERRSPGKLCVALSPSGNHQETVVMLRVVAIRQPDNPHDWHTLGSPVMLRLDMVGKMLQQDAPEQQRQRAILPPAGVPNADDPVNWGVTVQQLIDFRDDIRDDLEMYCRAHTVCTLEGKYNMCHVCMNDPCPYKPSIFSRLDDHRGVPHVAYSALPDVGDAAVQEALRPLSPDMDCVVQRYIKPMTRNTGRSHSGLMNPNKPVKASVFVTHAWSESFIEFVDTLQSALDPEDTVFVASFSLDQNRDSDFLVDVDIDEWLDDLFQKVEKVVVVVDELMAVTSRLWCNIEVLKAREHVTPVSLWPHKNVDLARLKDAIACIDVQTAKSTKESDAERLLDILRREDDHIENYNTHLRAFLQQRVVIFAESAQQAAKLNDFCPERMKQIHAEHERRVVLREVDDDHKREIENMNKEAARLALSKNKASTASAVQEFEFTRRLSQQRHIHEDEELLHEHKHQSEQSVAKEKMRRLRSDGDKLRQQVARLEEALAKQKEDAEIARNSAAQFQLLMAEENDNAKREAVRAEQERKAAEEERAQRRNEEERALTMRRMVSEANDRAREAADALARHEAEMEDFKQQFEQEREALNGQLLIANRRQDRATAYVNITPSEDDSEERKSLTSDLTSITKTRSAVNNFTNIANKIAAGKKEHIDQGLKAMKETTKDVASKGAQAVASTAASAANAVANTGAAVSKLGQAGANIGAETGKKIARFGKALFG